MTLWACGQSRVLPEAIPSQSFAIQPGQRVFIELNSGELNIHGTTDDRLLISGELASPSHTNYQVDSTADEIRIVADYSKPLLSSSTDPPVRLEVQIPADAHLRIETFDAEIALHEVRGTVEVDSSAGDILAEKLNGDISLRSGRGNIRAAGCSGTVRVIGEYGILVMEDVQGDVGSSTIMGTIRFLGGIDSDLETDHGPVEIDLAPSSNLVLSINTTGGDLTCSFPGLRVTPRSCQGQVGNGKGSLSVRTVSGKVNFQPMP
jgi:hypothetical protein